MRYDEDKSIAHFDADEQIDLGLPTTATLIEMYDMHAKIATDLRKIDARLADAEESCLDAGARYGEEYMAAGREDANLTRVFLGLGVMLCEIEDACLRRFK